MHPELSQLTRFVDREMHGRELRRVERHLAVCAACRSEAASLRLNLLPAAASPVPPAGELLAGMRQWWERQTQNPHANRQRKQRVAREIAPYLGAAGAQQILARVTPEGDNLIPNIEPVLAAFLGRRAAQCVVDHVIAIVRA